MTSLSSYTAINRCREKRAAKHSVNTKNNNPITLNGETLEETDSFTYLGSTVNKNGGTEEDVKARIQKARVAFIMFRKNWRAKQIKINT